jgi:hypothetical protein
MKIHLMFSTASILFLLIACSVGAESPPKPEAESCRTRSDLVGKCFTVHGRLSVYNGTPSIRLWPIGSKRLLGVLDPKDPSNAPGPSIFPTSIAGKLDWNKDVLGDFLVCPLTRAKPGRMQTICIESVKNLTVREHK